MTITEIFSLLLVHWFADFFCQTHWQAINKSSNNEALTQHVVTYSVIILIASSIVLGFGDGAIFGLITFCAHWTTDYFTSRWVKKLFGKQDFHNGFVVIGIDQILHYVQLILTYKWLNG